MANDRSHNALAQLSASAAMRKDESAQGEGTIIERAESADYNHDYDYEHEGELEEEL